MRHSVVLSAIAEDLVTSKSANWIIMLFSPRDCSETTKYIKLKLVMEVQFDRRRMLI